MFTLKLDATRGSLRESVATQHAADLAAAGLLAVDPRRARPRYFDGRFLTASDLNRDQQYVLAREAELARALGAGVTHGLEVRRGASSFEVVVAAGHGLTASGESVVLDTALTLDLADASQIRSSNRAFNLSRRPVEPAGNPAGLYVLGLRAVEYSANPITAFPTQVAGRRETQDGDIVEATAATLIPYPRGAGGASLDDARALAVRDIFVRGAALPVSDGVLPLAMLAIDASGVVWIDLHLLRRAAGAFDPGLFGATPRAQREAYFQQHAAWLDELTDARAAANLPPDFTAASRFRALPPAGLMPAACVNPADFSQNHFPPEVDVAISLVPSDEVAALLDDALRLDPIDLEAGTQEHLSVLILIPVTRQRLADLAARVTSVRRTLLPAAPNLLARQSALTRLRGIRLPTLPTRPAPAVGDDAWREALAGLDTLVYVRRRSLALREDPVGIARRVFGDAQVFEARVTDALRDSGLVTRVRTLRQNLPASTNLGVFNLLAAERVNTSPVLLAAAVNELEAARPTDATLDERAVSNVADRFGDPRLGEGVLRLETTEPALTAAPTRANLALSGVAPELDRVARELPEAELPEFSRRVAEAASRNDAATLRTLARVTR